MESYYSENNIESEEETPELSGEEKQKQLEKERKFREEQQKLFEERLSAEIARMEYYEEEETIEQAILNEISQEENVEPESFAIVPNYSPSSDLGNEKWPQDTDLHSVKSQETEEVEIDPTNEMCEKRILENGQDLKNFIENDDSNEEFEADNYDSSGKVEAEENQVIPENIYNKNSKPETLEQDSKNNSKKSSFLRRLAGKLGL